MDQLQGMRVFVRVVEAGSLSRAADSLGLPKGTVTRQIQALEKRLHVQLLNRTTRRLTVTPDGAAYFEQAARLLNEIDALDAGMANVRADPAGRLRLDVGTATAQFIVLPALQGFLDRYPQIQVDLGVSDRATDMIGDNVDCAIRIGQLTDPSLIARRIGDLEFVTVASRSYIARFGKPLHPRDLEKRHHVVHFFSGATRRHYSHEFRKGSEVIEISGDSRVAVNEGNALLKAVLGGFGISQFSRYAAVPYLECGDLIELFDDWSRAAIPVYIVYPHNRHLSAKVRAFVDWAAELFSKDPHLQIKEIEVKYKPLKKTGIT